MLGCRHRPARVLDLCTGNGSLAVLAAMRWPAAAVDATDVSTDALKVAEANVERHDLADRITLHHGDGFGPLRDRYDLIVCNPPYVNAQSMAALPPEFQAEPALALAGGDDGMDFIRPHAATRARVTCCRKACWCWRSATNASTSMRRFASLDAVGLPTSAGDDAVLLITRDALERLP